MPLHSAKDSVISTEDHASCALRERAKHVDESTHIILELVRVKDVDRSVWQSNNTTIARARGVCANTVHAQLSRVERSKVTLPDVNNMLGDNTLVICGNDNWFCSPNPVCARID
jgi:hypothetical protein